MAEIIVEATSGVNAGGMMGSVLSPIFFLVKNWYFLAFGILVSVLIGIVLYMVFNNKDLKRERDEAGYFLYKKTIKDCINGRDKKKYKKTYSFFKNILWFGLPLINKDESKWILDKRGNKLGRYRGHVQSQDGTYNLLVCTKTIMGMIDTNILIKVPIRIKTNKPNKKGKDEISYVNFDLVQEDVLDGSITIRCIGIERTALYYYMPIFTVIDVETNKEVIVDLRQQMESSVSDSTYQVMLQRMLNTGQKQMEKAMTFNPYLKYDQMSPDKTLPEQDVDKYGK